MARTNPGLCFPPEASLTRLPCYPTDLSAVCFPNLKISCVSLDFRRFILLISQIPGLSFRGLKNTPWHCVTGRDPATRTPETRPCSAPSIHACRPNAQTGWFALAWADHHGHGPLLLFTKPADPSPTAQPQAAASTCFTLTRQQLVGTDCHSKALEVPRGKKWALIKHGRPLIDIIIFNTPQQT